jgi:AraC-like DNA-binding protein
LAFDICVLSAQPPTSANAMLASAFHFEEGPVRLRGSLAFDPRFRLMALEKQGVYYDTRFIPPATTPPTGAYFFCILLSGQYTLASGERLLGPCVYLAPEEVFDGADSKFTEHYSLWGAPYRLIELRISSEFVVESGSARVQLVLGEPVLAAAESFFESALLGPASESATRELFRVLDSAGYLAKPLDAALKSETKLVQLAWNSLRPVLDSLAFSLTLDQVSAMTEKSPRQLRRVLDEFGASHGVPWAGWRDTAHRFRLRLASMLLSSADIPLQRVAERCGYGAFEALARGFQNAGLPTPAETRRQLIAARAVQVATSGLIG